MFPFSFCGHQAHLNCRATTNILCRNIKIYSTDLIQRRLPSKVLAVLYFSQGISQAHRNLGCCYQYPLAFIINKEARFVHAIIRNINVWHLMEHIVFKPVSSDMLQHIIVQRFVEKDSIWRNNYRVDSATLVFVPVVWIHIGNRFPNRWWSIIIHVQHNAN